MGWWSWVIGGAILLGSELVFVDAQFYLVFVGCSAIVVGVIAGAMPTLPEWAQWAIFAALAIISMVAFRSRLYDRVRGRAPAVRSGPAGEVLTLPAGLLPGQTCQTEHGGTFWTVRNDSDVAIAPGARAKIAQVQGLVLSVRPEP